MEISPSNNNLIEKNLTFEYFDKNGNGTLKIRAHDNSIIFLYYLYQERLIVYYKELKLSFVQENIRYFKTCENIKELYDSIVLDFLKTIKIEKRANNIMITFYAHQFGKEEEIKLELNEKSFNDIPTLIRLSETEDNLEKKNNEIKELKSKIEKIEKNNEKLEEKVNYLEKIINSRIPIYRYYGCRGDHFYTTSSICPYSYKSEGIEFYAFPNK